MEELIPWDRLADHQVLQVSSHETVESLRRRLVELGEHAQYNTPILIWLANGQVAPASVPGLRTLAQQRGASILRLRLESLLPELCPQPWAMEGRAEALAAARRRNLPVIATGEGEGVPVGLALPPALGERTPPPGPELFDLFDEALTPAAMAGTRFVVATLESTAADVAAALGQEGPDRDGTFVLLHAGGAFLVVDRRPEQEVADFASQVWLRTLAELRPPLHPAEARPYRDLGIRQAEAIAERTFLVLLDEQGQVAGLMPPPPRLAGQVLPAGTDHDLFDLPLPLSLEGAEPGQVILPGISFVLATPDTRVARIATDLKKLPAEVARGAYVLVQVGEESYDMVSAWELNDALASGGPLPWGQPLCQILPHRHAIEARDLETMGSRQVRLCMQAREPLLLLRQRRPWHLLPGTLQPAVPRDGAADLFIVPQQVLDPYLPVAQGTLEIPPRDSPQEDARPGGGKQERDPKPAQAVNFWFTTPEGHALAHEHPLELGRSYQLHLNPGCRAESAIAPDGPASRDRAPEEREGRLLHICLLSDDFDIPRPTRSLLTSPEGDSPTAVFDLTPLRASQSEEDPATIEIVVHYRGNLVWAWQARVEVVRAGQVARAIEPQRGVLLAARSRDCLLQDGLSHRRLSLFIDHAPHGYRFDLVLSLPGEKGEGPGCEGEVGEACLPWRARLRREDLVPLIARARRQLTSIARSQPYRAGVAVDKATRKRALQALALVGRQLYLGLFEGPQSAMAGHGAAGEVADWIRQEAGEGAVLQVVHRARDFVFPWGLIYDRPLWDGDAESIEVELEGFWGYRYEIELLTQELLQVPWKAGLEIGLGDQLRVAVGLNDRLAGAREQRQLFADLAAQGRGRTEYSLSNRGPDWLRLLSEGQHELLYLFCHGFTERMASDLDLADDLLSEFRAYLGSLPTEKRAQLKDQEGMLFDASDSWLKLTHGRMSLTMLRDCAPRQLEAAPLVLLNVCESAQVVPSLSGGFVPFFLERGARGVIGTECPTSAIFAHAFAREFFPRFLRGRPVGRILWELRRMFLQMGNPLGLAYTLYGDAGTRLGLPGSSARTSREATVAHEAPERRVEELRHATEEPEGT